MLLQLPDRKIIRLVYVFAGQLHLEPMEAINYALNVWQANTVHFSEDAHYIEGEQEISAIGTNAILLAVLDWRPGPAVRPWLRETLMVVNIASAALGATLMILRHQRLREGAPLSEIELLDIHKTGSEGLQLFLRTALDTARKDQIGKIMNAGQDLGVILGVDIQLSKDLCLWSLQNGEDTKYSPTPLLHPARKTLGSPWGKFCFSRGIGNEFIRGSVPQTYGTLEFRIPNILARMYLKTRVNYMWLGIKHRQVRFLVHNLYGQH